MVDETSRIQKGTGSIFMICQVSNLLRSTSCRSLDFLDVMSKLVMSRSTLGTLVRRSLTILTSCRQLTAIPVAQLDSAYVKVKVDFIFTLFLDRTKVQGYGTHCHGKT